MRLTNTQIEDLHGCKYSDEHVCKQNYAKDEFRILHCIEHEGRHINQWDFYNFRFSTSEDVCAGEAESIGEILSESMFRIGFCPFCGKVL